MATYYPSPPYVLSPSLPPTPMSVATAPAFTPRRHSCTYTTASLDVSHRPLPEPKRSVLRENKFVLSYGSRLHGYGREKAPYPMTYNRDDLELWSLDYELLRHAKQGVGSFVDFKGKYPKRCLDIGTGLGTWVIDAAKDWPDCSFVGYDLMNVQIPLRILEPEIADRIEWVHGNLLRTKLPFEDEEFDHVHIGGLAFGVPENKWISLYEEIRRVMRTGGTIEQIEEDAIFPVLPRWFTEPLHTHTRGPYLHLPNGSPFSPPSPSKQDEDPHEHALLESLFRDVFESRFINPTPTSSLPSYFSATFGHVISPPILARAMPPLAPLAPLAPLPNELIAQPSMPFAESSQSNGSTGGGGEGAGDEAMFLPPVPIGSVLDLSLPTESDLTLASSSTNGSTSTSASTAGSSSTFASTPTSRTSASHSAPARPPTAASHDLGRSSTSTSRSSTSPGSLSLSPTASTAARTPVPAADLRADSTSISIGGVGEGGEVALLPMESLLALEEHSLNMALFRALGLVLAAKEAMWEELMVRVARGDRRLARYGWEGEDYSEARSRIRFEGLVEQYRKDVRARISLWHSMVLNGWAYPRQDPLTRAEMMEEERLRQDILEARRNAKEEDLQGFSRLTRLMVGVKVRMDSLT